MTATTDENELDVDESPFEDFSPRTAFLEWLTDHLAHIEVVRGKPTPWCDQWWLHTEAVARFVALWKARLQADANMVENLEADSLWWLTHWDRHAQVIFDKTHGPFRDCDPHNGHLSRSGGATPLTAIAQPPAEIPLL